MAGSGPTPAANAISRALRLSGLALALAAPAAAQPESYVVDFLSTAARGIAVNARGDVLGVRSLPPACPSCGPGTETVVWSAGRVIPLPAPPGLPAVQARAINAAGWVVGDASPVYPGLDARAVVWRPVPESYESLVLDLLPGTTQSTGIGIDDANRVVGFAGTASFPSAGAPFLWSEADGLLDLTALGFPREAPAALSPGGTVALTGSFYSLDVPGSVTPVAPPPRGFFFPSSIVQINDTGDQARFLFSTSGENLAYLFRYRHDGTWQQLANLGSGHLSRWGLGSITPEGDVTATILSTGVVAYGPARPAELLTSKLAPPYAANEVTEGGPASDADHILAQVMMGRSARLSRLTPAEPCIGAPGECLRVATLEMTGRFIAERGQPGQCTPLASNRVVARVAVTDESGRPVRGVRVTGRFLDDYWLDEEVTATTRFGGVARFVHRGPACVGAVAFVVTGVSKPGHRFERTQGELTAFVIPLPRRR